MLTAFTLHKFGQQRLYFCLYVSSAGISEPSYLKQSIHRFNDLCIDINVDNYLLNVQIQIYAISLTWGKKTAENGLTSENGKQIFCEILFSPLRKYWYKYC